MSCALSHFRYKEIQETTTKRTMKVALLILILSGSFISRNNATGEKDQEDILDEDIKEMTFEEDILVRETQGKTSDEDILDEEFKELNLEEEILVNETKTLEDDLIQEQIRIRTQQNLKPGHNSEHFENVVENNKRRKQPDNQPKQMADKPNQTKMDNEQKKMDKKQKQPDKEQKKADKTDNSRADETDRDPSTSDWWIVGICFLAVTVVILLIMAAIYLFHGGNHVYIYPVSLFLTDLPYCVRGHGRQEKEESSRKRTCIFVLVKVDKEKR